MKKTICEHCGANQFNCVTENGRNFLECAYCGTRYEENNVQAKNLKMPNESICGIGSTGSYVVYGRLNVSGCNNLINLCETAPDSAATVRNLNVSGMNHRLSVRLMPGATKRVIGVNNVIR